MISAPAVHGAPLSPLELECPCEGQQAGSSESEPAYPEACIPLASLTGARVGLTQSGLRVTHGASVSLVASEAPSSVPNLALVIPQGERPDDVMPLPLRRAPQQSRGWNIHRAHTLASFLSHSRQAHVLIALN